jgi:hypothetical protein
MRFRDSSAQVAAAGLYAAGLVVVGMALVYRDLPSPRVFVWTGICELTGFVLVAAVAGWMWRRFSGVALSGRAQVHADRAPPGWFCWSQAGLAAVAASLILWILLDAAFYDIGEGRALFGLAGHMAACPAALMLVGTTIVMAWQTRGRWRGAWQYAALGAGVLFTSSIGWARIDPLSDAAWPRRVAYLWSSVLMMTLLTCFGLARVLPASGDWITRGRRAWPVFAAAAVVLGVVLVMHWARS